jgi:hypothetical protein
MKRSIKLSLLFAALFFFGKAPMVFSQTLKEFFSSSETSAVYLGLDFTLARVINDPSASAMDIRDRHYPAINALVVNEPKKFDLKAAFNKSILDNDLGPVAKRNAKINTEEMTSTSSADYRRLKEDDIAKLVKGFDFDGKKGIGILFVVEAMSKAEKGESIWVTFIDMANKKVLMTERIENKTAMGFGFRNFWANPVKALLETIEKKKYKEWKAKYAG